jgi:hypothetical protein
MGMTWKGVLALQLVAASLSMSSAASVTMFEGQWTCGVWLNARSMHRNQHMEGWVAGYLSGLSVAYDALGFKDTLRNTDALSAYVWIDSWCKAHPLDDVATAANGFAEEASARAGKVVHPSPR